LEERSPLFSFASPAISKGKGGEQHSFPSDEGGGVANGESKGGGEKGMNMKINSKIFNSLRGEKREGLNVPGMTASIMHHIPYHQQGRKERIEIKD